MGFASETLEGGVSRVLTGVQTLARARTTWRAGDTLTKTIPEGAAAGGPIDLDYVEYQTNMTAVATTSTFTIQQDGLYRATFGGSVNAKANDWVVWMEVNGSIQEALVWGDAGAGDNDIHLKFKAIEMSDGDTAEFFWYVPVADDPTGNYDSPGGLGLTGVGMTYPQMTNLWIELEQIPEYNLT